MEQQKQDGDSASASSGTPTPSEVNPAAARKKVAPRFVIEGEWSGYTSRQQRIVHRQVYPGSRKALRAWAAKTHSIVYTDGTCLFLTVRDLESRERVKEIKGYTRLIEDCARHNVNRVDALPND